MTIATLLILTAVTLSACAFAHLRIREHAGSTRHLVRLTLIVVGADFGSVMTLVYTDSDSLLERLLIFLSAFGTVHIPAAFILQIKHVRGSPHRDD